MSIKINIQENKYFKITKSPSSAIDLSLSRTAFYDWIKMNNGLVRSQDEDTTFYSSDPKKIQFRWKFDDEYQLEGKLITISGITLPYQRDINDPMIHKPLSTNPGRFRLTIEGYHEFPNMIKKTLDVIALGHENKFSSLRFLDLLNL